MKNPDKVLIAYATEAGSTQEIAELIAARPRRNSLLTQVNSAVDAPDPAAFDAVITYT